MLLFWSAFTPPNSRDLTDMAFPGALVIGEWEAISELDSDTRQVNTLPESTTHHPAFTDCERSPDQLHWLNA